MARGVNIEELLNKFNTKHNSFYKYDKFIYKAMKIKAIITCPIHGDFEQAPDNHLKSGCSKCGQEKSNKAKYKSLEYYKNKINKHFNGAITIKEAFGDKAQNEVIATCNIHGDFNTRLAYLSEGKGCKKCAIDKRTKSRRNTTDKILNVFTEKHGDKYVYPDLTGYKNGRQKINIFCNKHQSYFEQSIESHMVGHGCPKCGKELTDTFKSDTQESFLAKAELINIENKLNFDKVVYKGTKDKIIVTCNTHGDFELTPNALLQGQSCPKCNSNRSKAEKEIAEFLKEYVNIKESDRKTLGNRELDIFIPSLNLAIEYNGLYWHSNKFVEDNYHKEKLELCLEKGIRLVQIFEDEWRDKKDIVKSRLLNLINKTQNKIYARNCEIREVDSKESLLFLEQNHIQGKLGAKIRLGLYYNNELVSLMTFGNLRKSLGSKGEDTDYELLRFCNKTNTTVIGGASKLLKYFKKKYTYTSLISYADRRWSEGNLYKNLDFELVSKTKPNYFYTKGVYRENRFKYRKSEINKNKENKTEREIMSELGYYRIYDAGTLKFKLK